VFVGHGAFQEAYAKVRLHLELEWVCSSRDLGGHLSGSGIHYSASRALELRTASRFVVVYFGGPDMDSNAGFSFLILRINYTIIPRHYMTYSRKN